MRPRLTRISSTPISSSRRWWIAPLVALLLLALTDLVVRALPAGGGRFAEQFSSREMVRRIDAARGTGALVLVLGDSALWGYRLPAADATAARLQAALPAARVLDLSFEGGSPANTDVALRLALAHGLRPAVVLFNVNPKEFNPADSAYRRLHPALRRAAEPLLTVEDRTALEAQPAPDLNGRLNAAVERVWRLYEQRVDLRERIFGRADAATALRDALWDRTGASRRAELQHAPTAERFLATYDMSRIERSNVALRYLDDVGALVRQHHLRAVAFLTPTNHTLLHEYIDVPEYDANLALVRAALERAGITVLDLDRAVPAREFLDNDHLTAAGQTRLTARLLPLLRAQLR